MRSDVFWAIRYTAMGLSLVCAVGCMYIILKNKLQARLLMLYIFLMSLCEALMAISAFLFTSSFIDVNSDDKLNHQQPWVILSQLQGYVFRTAELTSFTLTAAITLIIYYVISNKMELLKRRKKFFLIVSLVAPAICMLPTIFYYGNGPCFHGQIYFNCVCPNTTQSYALFIFNWVVPCTILAFLTLVVLFKIRKRKISTTMYEGVKGSQKLALLTYYIPPSNFVILEINLLLTFIADYFASETINTILVMVNLLVFAMPLVCVVVIGLYFQNQQSYKGSTIQESLVTNSSNGSIASIHSGNE